MLVVEFMIGYMEGEPFFISKEKIILKVQNGVGYEVYCTKGTLHAARDQGLVQLWVHTYVKEDKIELFGFKSLMEKTWFLSLIKINGIGPKVALQILSSKSLSDLSQMIEAKDVRSLMTLPKVGRKIAEQIILGLRNQVKSMLQNKEQKTFPIREEITSALYHLGFKQDEVSLVINNLDYKLSVQDGIRKALVDLQSIKDLQK